MGNHFRFHSFFVVREGGAGNLNERNKSRGTSFYLGCVTVLVVAMIMTTINLHLGY